MLNSFVPPLAASGRLRRVPSRLVVVVAGPNPSFSYYLEPRGQEDRAMPMSVADIGAAPSPADARRELAGAFVLFCRYTNAAWLRAIESCSDVIAGIGLFVDDDMDALFTDSSVPLSYRIRLWRLHLAHRRRLSRLCDILFVATPKLVAHHAAAYPHKLSPIATEDDLPKPRAEAGPIRIAFHSTFVHAAERRWLQPVMNSVLRQQPSVSFEVTAGVYAGLPMRKLSRTQVTPSRPWPRYRAESREQGADLLLAPLLPTEANAARSWTKRIDAMRLGAALLASDPEVYRPDPQELSLGMCLPLDPAKWADAIVELTCDRVRLARLRDLNRTFVLRESAAAGPLFTAAMLQS
jgi:hypothetical protein